LACPRQRAAADVPARDGEPLDGEEAPARAPELPRAVEPLEEPARAPADELRCVEPPVVALDEPLPARPEAEEPPPDEPPLEPPDEPPLDPPADARELPAEPPEPPAKPPPEPVPPPLGGATLGTEGTSGACTVGTGTGAWTVGTGTGTRTVGTGTGA
jgi:hypothetical protein